MNALCDIETAQDVKTLVDAFYAKVNCDELLAPIFNETAQVDWPQASPDDVPLLAIPAIRER